MLMRRSMGVHPLLEKADRRAARKLGAINCAIGAAQQRMRHGTVVRSDRNSYAHAKADSCGLKLQGARYGLDYALAKIGDIVGRRHMRVYDCKFVTAKPRQE